MAEQQDALPLPGCRIDLVLSQQPPRLVDDHPILHQLQQIPLRHRGGEEVALNPPRRQRPLPPLSRSRRLPLLLPRLHLAGLTLGHGGSGEVRCAEGGEEDEAMAKDPAGVTKNPCRRDLSKVPTGSLAGSLETLSPDRPQRYRWRS
ncbi:hypothetical protein ZWY2020_053683 [Hordeum vulgare]|nr:hypothetical protein ZWY2020_053683 [Hordeum vulgare]